MDEKVITFGGRKFLQKRKVVCEHPLETKVVSREL